MPSPAASFLTLKLFSFGSADDFRVVQSCASHVSDFHILPDSVDIHTKFENVPVWLSFLFLHHHLNYRTS